MLMVAVVAVAATYYLFFYKPQRPRLNATASG
jgi:hypothetical protein